jgi:hypothetical protein
LERTLIFPKIAAVELMILQDIIPFFFDKKEGISKLILLSKILDSITEEP